MSPIVNIQQDKDWACGQTDIITMLQVKQKKTCFIKVYPKNKRQQTYLDKSESLIIRKE